MKNRLIKSGVLFKFLLFLTVLNANLFSCTAPIINIPIIDAYVKIDAKKSNTSFSVTWKFNKEFMKSLTHYDTNKNGKFDKDEQENIKKVFVGYIKQNNYLTDVIYVKKGLKIKKSLIQQFDIIDSELIFSNGDIKYNFNFNIDLVLKEDHRLYIRFFDIKSNIGFTLKDIIVNNYNGVKVIEPQNTRANIYFYKYIPKIKIAKESNKPILEIHDHYEEEELHL